MVRPYSALSSLCSLRHRVADTTRRREHDRNRSGHPGTANGISRQRCRGPAAGRRGTRPGAALAGVRSLPSVGCRYQDGWNRRDRGLAGRPAICAGPVRQDAEHTQMTLAGSARGQTSRATPPDVVGPRLVGAVQLSSSAGVRRRLSGIQPQGHLSGLTCGATLSRKSWQMGETPEMAHRGKTAEVGSGAWRGRVAVSAPAWMLPGLGRPPS